MIFHGIVVEGQYTNSITPIISPLHKRCRSQKSLVEYGAKTNKKGSYGVKLKKLQSMRNKSQIK